MNNVSVVGCFQLRSIRVACAHHGFLWGYESWKDLPVAGCVYLQVFHVMKNCFSKLVPLLLVLHCREFPALLS